MFGEMSLDELAVYLHDRRKLTVQEEEQLLNDRRQGAKDLLYKYRRRVERNQKEKKRLHKMLQWERGLWRRGLKILAGVDEAGRGPLAGPVVAAAVILPGAVYPRGLNDSKQLTPRRREELFALISGLAIGIGIGIGPVELIDRINIYGATMVAMAAAVKNLSLSPSAVLVDGYPIRGLDVYQVAITGGDSRSLSIAAASVVAKVTRDRLMEKLHDRYPVYGFDRHKGYPTLEHREALQKYGLCPAHRRSFQPCMRAEENR